MYTHSRKIVGTASRFVSNFLFVARTPSALRSSHRQSVGGHPRTSAMVAVAASRMFANATSAPQRTFGILGIRPESVCECVCVCVCVCVSDEEEEQEKERKKKCKKDDDNNNNNTNNNKDKTASQWTSTYRRTLTVSSTMTPSVPSLPTYSCVSSYPVALLRTRRRVRTRRPSGVTTSRDTTFSAVVPYLLFMNMKTQSH